VRAGGKLTEPIGVPTMAKGRKSGPSRLDLRRQSDAAEARDEEEVETEEEEVDEDDEEEEEVDEAEEPAEDDDEDGPPKKKKSKAKPKKEVVAKPKAKRTRAPKIVVMRAIWVVFDNSNKRLNTFPFKDKKEAEAFLEKKQEEKKGTYYLQLVKEELKESKV
jgi:outer membrane biosynthesis protein TonB